MAAPPFRSLADRRADQAKAKERLAERARKIAAGAVVSKQPQVESKPRVTAPLPTVAQRAHRSWAEVRAGNASIKYSARATSEEIAPQPWTKDLTSTVLEAADRGGVTLCLVWPGKLNSLPILHALANMERLFAKDLRGLRTLFYPGTHVSRAALQGALVDRTQLSDFYLTLWGHQPNGLPVIESHTSSPAIVAALGALHDLRIRHPEVPNPSLAELIPTFVFDTNKRAWATTVTNPLERTLCKVARLSQRKLFRQEVGPEWGAPERSPGTLMILHHTARKNLWRVALTSSALRGAGRPEVLLLDATQAAAQTNYTAVKQIPNFLQFAHENGFADVGAVVVTDDPKTFFVLRAQMYQSKMGATTKVWAAEADEVLLSTNPVESDWKPEQRSNTNFSISIVDRDASQVALAYQRLSASAGAEESLAYQALITACTYVLWLSNMPAGYADLTAASSQAEGADFESRVSAWTSVSLALSNALASGALNSVRAELEKTIRRTEDLIDSWNDSTPMASRLLAEVKKHAVNGRHGVSIVLPNNRFVLLAHRFLRRKLEGDWAAVETRLNWHTLSSVARTLGGDRKGKHFAFVGVSPDVLRILVTHPDVPHGTTILVAYRQAESTLRTLAGMKELEAFKPYRGRIGLLAQELERRLKEIPNPIAIEKLRDMPTTFRFDDDGQHGANREQGYYTFELEGSGRAYASGWVYRYVPDEDPPFRRAAANAICSGEFIFEMSDELRAKVESLLHPSENGVSSVVDPLRMMLRLYHQDVQTRCNLMFKATKRSALAREIHAKMVEMDPKSSDCRVGRVYYWLALQAEGDTRPHASKDAKYFKAFCKALEISDENAESNWGFIRNARRLNQYLGRELVARYAEILFRPESAAIYRKVPEDVIEHLQQEALRCVYRVENVVPPPVRISA